MTAQFKTWLLLAAERAGKTGLQVLISLMFAGGIDSIKSVPWTHALGAAVLAMLISVLTSLGDAGFTSTNFWVETAIRAGKTFVQSLLATLGAGYLDLFSVPWTSALAVALGTTLLSVATSLASAPFGLKGSPSLVDPAVTSGPAAG